MTLIVLAVDKAFPALSSSRQNTSSAPAPAPASGPAQSIIASKPPNNLANWLAVGKGLAATAIRATHQGSGHPEKRASEKEKRAIAVQGGGDGGWSKVGTGKKTAGMYFLKDFFV